VQNDPVHPEKAVAKLINSLNMFALNEFNSYTDRINLCNLYHYMQNLKVCGCNIEVIICVIGVCDCVGGAAVHGDVFVELVLGRVLIGAQK
jgi:hypothetical protein